MEKLWFLKRSGYDPRSVVSDGNRFLIANGYMGVRGTVEESGSDACPAVNLAGVYDRYGSRWREPVNAPNGLFVKVFVNGKPMALGEAEPVSHSLAISYRHGIFSRDTDFGAVSLSSRRIASMAQPHLLASNMQLRFDVDCQVTLCTGISADIWDINGPHLFEYRFETGDTLLCEAVTGEKKIPVAVAQCVRRDFDAVETCESGEASCGRFDSSPKRARCFLWTCSPRSTPDWIPIPLQAQQKPSHPPRERLALMTA